MKKEKLLSPFAVFLLGINSIIGSGIFLLSGHIYSNAGIYSLLAIAAAGLSILVIALSYANMSKLYPESGGAFVYAKNIFGPFAGFIIGMLTWILGVVTLATEVSALMTALQMIYPNINIKLVGLIILVLLASICFFGASILNKLDNLTSLVKLLIVVIFSVTCIWLFRGVNFIASPKLSNIHHLSGNYLFLSGLTVFMSFAQYLSTGFANIRKKFIFIGLGSVLFSLILLLSFTVRVLTIGFSIVIGLSLIYFFSQKLARQEKN